MSTEKSSSFLHIWKISSVSKKALTLPFLFTVVSSVLSLITPLLIMKIMDDLNDYINYNLIYLGIILLVLSTIFSSVSNFLLSRLAEKIILNMRKKIWEKTLNLPLKFYHKKRSGDLVSRLTNDTTEIVDVMTHELMDLLEAVITLIISIIILFFLDVYLTLIILILVPFSTFIIYPLAEKVFNLSYKEQERLADLTSFSSGILKDIKLVKAFNAEEIEKKKGENKFKSLYQLGIKYSILNAIITPLLGLFSFVILVAVVGFGAWRVSTGIITLGELVAFIIYLIQVVTPFLAMNMFITNYQEARGSIKRIMEVLSEKDEIEMYDSKTKEFPCIFSSSDNLKLDFKNVSFSYKEDDKVLDEVSFSLETGNIVALVGPSGSGKSTIFSLIERFYHPKSGDITLNNISYRDVSINDWRKVFSYVPQDFPLFYGTIKDNLTYGIQRNISEEELIEVTKKANAHHFIMNFSNGYNTHVGEFGNYLSGGQKQRIAIARALLRKSKFILLDEVTANLDSESEYLLHDTFKSLSKENIGLFMIAHRLSTIKDADRILVLENGSMIGNGNHHHLYKTNSYYRKAIENQNNK